MSRVVRILVMMPLVLIPAVLAACSCADAGMVATRDADVAGADRAPPFVPYCEGSTVVRTLTGPVTTGVPLQDLQVFSGITSDIVAASYVDPTGARLGTVVLWVVDRITGTSRRILSLDGDLFLAAERSDDDGATILLQDRLGALQRVRWRWREMEPHLSEPIFSDAAAWVIARRDPAADVLVRSTTDRVTGSVRLDRWTWSIDGDVQQAAIDDPRISDLRVGAGALLVSRATALPFATVVVVQAVTTSSEAPGRIVWLDRDVTVVRNVLNFRAGPLTSRGSVIASTNDAVIVATESDRVALWRSDAVSVERLVDLPFGFSVTDGSATGEGDPLYVSVPAPSAGFADPEERLHDSPVYVAEVEVEGGSISGGLQPVITGSCTTAAVAGVTEGGAFVASDCGPNEALSVTYFCVAGVE